MSRNQSSSERPTVSLVLGSGGARGLAHIGVIRALEKAGYDIRTISGSSMGALIGGIHAAGRLDAYEEWVRELEQSDILGLVDWTFSGGGLIRGRKIIDKLGGLIGRYDIEDLDIDFTAVAVDLDLGREVWLDRGPLFDAIRASIAIPGVFTPHDYRGRTLIDGGILNPVPIAPTLRAMNDRVVVVDVNAPAVQPPPLSRTREDDDSSNGMVRKVREFMNGWRDNDRKDKDERPGLMAVMMRALDTMEAAIARHHMAIFRSDIMISVPKNTCFVHEFHRASEVIELGERLAERALRGAEASGGYTD
jgi:NTE family protein